jgi:PmbA protein
LSRREARSFQPSAIAHRLADRLLLRHEGSSPRRDRGEMLLGPSIGGRLLAGLLPLFVGAGAEKLARSLHDRSARIGSRWLTVIDNGRFPGGVLEAPVDGEGAPTREVLLVEEGRFRQPLLSWRRRSQGEASGCVRRSGWRDLPVISPSHLYLAPTPEVRVAELLAAVSRGYYLIEAPSAGEFDLESDRFRLPVSGFALRQGKAVSPLAGAELVGSISGWLHGIQASARDLEFRSLAGMLGSPTTLVTGLELRQIST